MAAKKTKKNNPNDLTIGSNLAKRLIEMELMEVNCTMHPKYQVKRKPRTDADLKDGCTCQMAWAYSQMVAAIQEAAAEAEESDGSFEIEMDDGCCDCSGQCGSKKKGKR